jgi:hypothetical protein
MGHAGPINTQNPLVVLSKPVGIVRLLPPLKTTAPKDGTGTEAGHTPQPIKWRTRFIEHCVEGEQQKPKKWPTVPASLFLRHGPLHVFSRLSNHIVGQVMASPRPLIAG